MELDLPKTIAAFVILIGLGVGALLGAPMGMTTDTILTMVLPSMAIFGAVALLIGVAHGQYRATH